MSLFDPNVRLAVLRLRNGRMLDDQANISIGRMMDNRRFSRADGDAMNDREEEFGYKQGETAEDLQDGDAVRGGAAAGKPMAKSKREQEEEAVRKMKQKKRKSKREQEKVKVYEAKHGEVDDIELPPEKPEDVAEEEVVVEGGKKKGGKRKQSDKMKRRTALVKKLMREKGMKMIEASKYIKANNMKY